MWCAVCYAPARACVAELMPSLLSSSHLENQTFGRFAPRLGSPNYIGVLFSSRADSALLRGYGERSPGCPRERSGRIPSVCKCKRMPQCRLQAALWELLWVSRRQQAPRGGVGTYQRYSGSVAGMTVTRKNSQAVNAGWWFVRDGFVALVGHLLPLEKSFRCANGDSSKKVTTPPNRPRSLVHLHLHLVSV